MEEIYKKAIEAALKAGEQIMKVYQADNFDVKLKSDESPLTEADQLAHQQIVSILGNQIPILSEEGAKIPFQTRKNWEKFWMVDPLDGTKEFIKRNGEFTVNIALIEYGKPVFGVVYAPVLEKLYVGGQNLPPYCTFQGNTQKLPLQKRENIENTRIVASRSHLNEATESYIQQYPQKELVSMGSSLKFMLIAEGNADVYPRFAPTMEWDTAAAHAVLRAMGIPVYQIDSDQELIYNKENLLNPYFLVKNVN